MNNESLPLVNIGVDHGYKNMKTREFCFPSCISKLDDVPDDLHGILQYNGSVYTEFGNPIQYVNTKIKSDTEDFYLLTLIALGKELKARKLNKAKVNLLTGLPQKWYYNQKKEFRDYLSKNKEIQFRYEGEFYLVIINDVKIFSQGYAAFMTIDGTRNIVSIINGQVNNGKSKIDTKASIWLLDQINEVIETELNNTAPESVIIDYIKNGGRNKPAQNKYEEIMKRELVNYAKDVYTTLKKFRFNIDLIPIIFSGGGAEIMKNFGDNPNAIFISDICANAKGYEIIYDLMGGGSQ